tara:strand:- start:38 stop:241 length:204 start_codon:yes stop_codon:yes gene_type:complete
MNPKILQSYLAWLEAEQEHHEMSEIFSVCLAVSIAELYGSMEKWEADAIVGGIVESIDEEFDGRVLH